MSPDAIAIAAFAVACIAFPFVLRWFDSKRNRQLIAHKEAKK